MLRPSERWFWTYCAEKDRLLLDISDSVQYCSPFGRAQLLHQPQTQPLSMAEAEAFWAIDDSLQQLDLPPAVRLELCLAALCSPFLQQTAHKSWYFKQGAQCDATQYAVVTLDGQSQQYALLLQTEVDSVTCLLLGDIITLAGKVLPRLQVIRLLRNRVSAFKADTVYRCSA